MTNPSWPETHFSEAGAKFGREDGIGGKVGRWGLVVSSTVEALGEGNRSVDDQSISI